MTVLDLGNEYNKISLLAKPVALFYFVILRKKWAFPYFMLCLVIYRLL